MSMKLKPEYAGGTVLLTIRYDTGDGETVESAMPASAALEIVNRSAKVERSREKGFEIVCDGRWRFPAEPFEGGRSGGSRPTKAELLEEMGEEMTNPELAEALDEAKEAHGKPARARAKGRAKAPSKEA